MSEPTGELDRVAARLVLTIDGFPVPRGPDEIRVARRSRGSALAPLLAAMLALLLVASQLGAVQSAVGSLADELARRFAPRGEIRPPTTGDSNRPASQVLGGAKLVILRASDFKVRTTHRGPYFGFNETLRARGGTDWVLTERMHCPDRAASVLSSRSTGFYEERISIGSTVYTRRGPEPEFAETTEWALDPVTMQDPLCNTERAAAQLVSWLDYDQIGREGVLGSPVPCGADTCLSLLTTDLRAWAAELVAGRATHTLLIEERTYRPVEVRIRVDWRDGTTSERVIEFFDFGVPNVIEPPK